MDEVSFFLNEFAYGSTKYAGAILNGNDAVVNKCVESPESGTVSGSSVRLGGSRRVQPWPLTRQTRWDTPGSLLSGGEESALRRFLSLFSSGSTGVHDANPYEHISILTCLGFRKCVRSI
jgi:hypothetical protein